jgi:hypothetical protein
MNDFRRGGSAQIVRKRTIEALLDRQFSYEAARAPERDIVQEFQ